MEDHNDNVVLENRQWLDQPRLALWYALALAVIVLLPVVLALILARAAHHGEEPWPALIARLLHAAAVLDWGRLATKLALLLASVLALAAHLAYAVRARRLERLTLSPAGIAYTSALWPWLRALRPDWFLPLRDIRQAELLAPQHGEFKRDPGYFALTLSSAGGRRRIRPAQWVEARPALPPAQLRRTPEEAAQAVMECAVLRYLAQHAPHLIVTPQSRHDASSLERNAHGRAASAIVVALLLYAIVDAVAGPWSYAEPPLSIAYIHVTVGALAALLAASWLRASTLRRMEKAGLALLIGVVSTAAMIPGALRINALTAPAAAAYPYYIEPGPGGIILRPAAQGMPAIDYFGDSAFWSSFSATRTYPVELRRGALGFYQFNSAAIVEDMRRYAGH